MLFGYTFVQNIYMFTGVDN